MPSAGCGGVEGEGLVGMGSQVGVGLLPSILGVGWRCERGGWFGDKNDEVRLVWRAAGVGSDWVGWRGVS